MSQFSFNDDEALGFVSTVDTTTIVLEVSDVTKLRRMQVNRLILLQSSRAGQHLIGVINRITRACADVRRGQVETSSEPTDLETNLVRVTLIGTLCESLGKLVLRRTLETVPEIDAKGFPLEGDNLARFMNLVSNSNSSLQPLSLGTYTLDPDAVALLDGNKLFQRHAIVVGSTGSGKSWTTARLLEQVSALSFCSSIVFDIHGEYSTLKGESFRHLRVASPTDIEGKRGLSSNVLYLPYWLLSFDAMIAMFIDHSDASAPNQSAVMARTVRAAREDFLEKANLIALRKHFTGDSPIPFDLDGVLHELERLNMEKIEGASAGREKQGPYFDKLSRLITRLETKKGDRRLGFLFSSDPEIKPINQLDGIIAALFSAPGNSNEHQRGVTIVDFSEVPSDILPIIVSLIARIAFSLQQWTPVGRRHPVAIFCDEAHLYLPESTQGDSADRIALEIFERIAKEGRKYGVGLVVISQRPSEVNRTILSQCNNVIAMRLTNAEDQAVIRRLLPDSLGSLSESLPILDVGEALVVGDSCLLPTRIRVSEPTIKPNGATIDFWNRWSDGSIQNDIKLSVENWRHQSLRQSPEI